MLAITNAKIMTMADRVIENGTILIDGKKIVAVDAGLTIPEGAEVIDAKGRLTTPGLVDPHSHIGIGEEGIGKEGQDYNEVSNPVTPQMRAIDAIYPDDKGFLQARQAGVTSVVTGPGSANCIGGSFVALKTFGRRVDDMVIKNPVAMKMAFGENIKRVYGSKDQAPTTRMGIAALIRENLLKAKQYMLKKEHGEQPDYNIQYEALIPVLKGQLTVKAHAHRTDDIFTAIRIAKEFGLKMTLDHCTEGHLIADLLAGEPYAAICGPNLTSASKYETRNRSFTTPAALYREGVKLAIMTDNSVVPTAQLPLCAGLACRSGLPEEEAFKAITIHAAEITGIGDRVGSLEVGKDADLVIWTKNPVKDVDCQAAITIIDGHPVYRMDEDEKFGF